MSQFLSCLSCSYMEREQIEKFKRYEVECRRYLMSKYFSDKNIFGGNIFDVKMTEDGEATKVSRFPGYQSYVDPANFNDDNSSKSNSTSEIHAKRKQPSKKNWKVAEDITFC
nr:uncharacterized protein LOC104084907 isoform X2 [Nicotiana tomentosiformis]